MGCSEEAVSCCHNQTMMLNDNDTAIITLDAKVLMRHRHFLNSVKVYTGSNTVTCDTICDMLCSKKRDLMLRK